MFTNWKEREREKKRKTQEEEDTNMRKVRRALNQRITQKARDKRQRSYINTPLDINEM